jgi:acyl-CoA reductase-like NAD-dependent aldehyde dehydrogenase
MAWMASWKFVALALKAQRGWKRIPPDQRRQIIENATKQARKHGPLVAKRAAEIAKHVRKDR